MSIECPLCSIPLKPNHLSFCARWWLKFQRISKIKVKWPSIRSARCPAYSDPAVRKDTFALWQPHQKPPVEELVRHGFFFTGEGDIVSCFWCKGRIGYWTAEDDPLERHVQDLPECSFAWFACEVFCTEEVPKAFHDLGPDRLPRHTSMIEASRRLESFREWTLEPFVRKKRPSKDNLVQCGFFSTEDKLFVRCFWCDLEINYPWFHSENALEDHLRMKPECPFAQNVNIRAEVTDDRLLCKICVTNEVEVALVSCGHATSCTACTKLIHHCPICRKCISEKLRIYIS